MKTLVLTICLFLSPAIAFANLSATISWNVSPEPDVDTYNVYRQFSTCAAFTGKGTKIGSVPHPAHSYVDTTIPDGTTVVAYKVTVEDLTHESTQSPCAEKTFGTVPPPVIDPPPVVVQPPYDDTAIKAALAALDARLDTLEPDVDKLVKQRDKMKAGLCALTGNLASKPDVVAEKSALGGCP